MTEQQFHEKDEKNEKERDKTEEKSPDEKWRRDPLGTLVWAAIFIWAGLVLLADNLGWLGQLPFPRLLPSGLEVLRPGAWTLIFIGAGVIVLIEVIIRLLVPTYRQPIGGSLVFAAILLGIGLGNIFGWELVLPFVVIAIGLGMLLRGFARRKS